MDDAALRQAFHQFCAFGAGQAGVAEMDNVKFAKLARDCNLLDKKLDKTSVDMIFTAKKPKGGRRIGYAEFVECVKAMAKARSGADSADAVRAVRDAIVSAGGPKGNATTKVDSDAALQRQTDTALYTGAHKERFDESGHGRGKAGREQKTGGLDLSDMLDRSEADVRGVNRKQQ